jgi:hypothetical protein
MEAGEQWSRRNGCHGLAVDPNNSSKLHVAIRGKGDGIYRTADGGAKWTGGR